MRLFSGPWLSAKRGLGAGSRQEAELIWSQGQGGGLWMLLKEKGAEVLQVAEGLERRLLAGFPLVPERGLLTLRLQCHFAFTAPCGMSLSAFEGLLALSILWGS